MRLSNRRLRPFALLLALGLVLALIVPLATRLSRAGQQAASFDLGHMARQPEDTQLRAIFLPEISVNVRRGQPCPAWVHDRYVTTGPDGRLYPTWHPPIDPEFGCLFGHEHGADPRSSRADPSLPAFGYAAALMGMQEPHQGFKVFVINQ